MVVGVLNFMSIYTVSIKSGLRKVTHYPLAYLEYLNKYALTANVSAYVKYVNTYACQNYLRKIVVLRISVSGRWSRICRAQLSYINSFDMHMYVLTYLTYVETFVVNAYLFKYFKYAEG